MEQPKQQFKEQFKHQLRDALVKIGAEAIEHALRFTKDAATLNQIQECLAVIRSHDVQRISAASQSFVLPQTYSIEFSLLQATGLFSYWPNQNSGSTAE